MPRGWAPFPEFRKKSVAKATGERIVFLFIKTFVELACIKSGLSAQVAKATSPDRQGLSKGISLDRLSGNFQPVAGRAECLTL